MVANHRFQALNHKEADAIGILDNRSATHCKLEQYDQARRDAKHMIKNAKEDERVSGDSLISDYHSNHFQGYLRCAKVLLLEGKPEKALEIYAYGLKVLPSKHPRREVCSLVPRSVIAHADGTDDGTSAQEAPGSHDAQPKRPLHHASP